MRKTKRHHIHRVVHGTKRILKADLSTDIRTLPFLCDRKRMAISVIVAVSFVTLLGLKASEIGMNMLFGEKRAEGAIEDVGIINNEPELGTTEGIGTHFELTNSQYLDVTVDSIESVEMSIESAPEIIIMRVAKGSTDRNSTSLTIGGLSPSTTFHKYEDGYNNHEEFVADEAGKFTFPQDISVSHIIFIQPRPSTKFIRDDETGGDCTTFGSWDGSTKTCLLNSDVSETIQIDSDNIILDGNGHRITGSGTGNGVYLSGRTSVVVRNLIIQNFFSGIYAYQSTNTEISSDTVSGCTHGIYLDHSSGNRISNNSISSNKSMGIQLYYSNSNELNGNTASMNYYSGVYLNYSNGNNLSNNTASNNNPNIPKTSYQQGGFNLKNSSNNVFEANTTNSNYNNGVVAQNSSGNSFNGGTINANVFYGFDFIMSSSNSATGNNISGNGTQGIYLWGGQGNTISSNRISGGSNSIMINSSNNNTIYNNLLRNNNNVSVDSSSVNVWNINVTSGTNIIGGVNLGGNYWTNSTGTGFSDTCADSDGNGICDTSYSISSTNIDSFPLARPDATAPSTAIDVSGISGENSWYVSSVEITLNATDNSGGTGVSKTEYSFDNASWMEYFSPFSIADEGEIVVYYRSIDNAGNIEETKNAPLKIDKTGPAISGGAITSPNSEGWYKGDVIVRFACSDVTSGAESTTFDMTISTEGANQQVLGKCKDRAGNSAQLSVGEINIDKTAPIVSVLRSPDANSKGWNNAPVNVTFAASDSLSGISGNPTSTKLFDAEGAGQSASYSFSDKAGNLASTSISNINIDLTIPLITGAATEIPNANGWYGSDVTVRFTASDSLSGLMQVSPDVIFANEGADQQTTGFADDLAGNHAAHTVSGINIDKTPPVISGEKSSLPNENGWYSSDVTVKFIAQDSLSGIGSVTPDVTISGEGKDQSALGIAVDKAGNEANVQISGINLDKTSPVVTGSSTISPNANGWYNTDVTIHFSATDLLSGIATVSPDSIIMSEGVGQSVQGVATDKAGNSGNVTVDGINIDRTAPDTVATLSGASDGSCVSGNVDITLTASDILSGIAGISYSIDNGGWLSYLGNLLISTEGQHILKYYSLDKADNSEESKSISFSIENSQPEASIKFDPQSEDIKVYDAKSGKEVSFVVTAKNKKDEEGKAWDMRKYTLAGCGNNTLTLVLRHKKEGNEAKIDLVSLQYGNSTKKTIKDVEIEAEFSRGKGASLKELEQKIDAEKLFEVEAKYGSSKNMTEIKIKPEGKKVEKYSVQGMALIQLVTEKGGFKYKY